MVDADDPSVTTESDDPSPLPPDLAAAAAFSSLKNKIAQFRIPPETVCIDYQLSFSN